MGKHKTIKSENFQEVQALMETAIQEHAEDLTKALVEFFFAKTEPEYLQEMWDILCLAVGNPEFSLRYHPRQRENFVLLTKDHLELMKVLFKIINNVPEQLRDELLHENIAPAME
jgi:hypothetical protein